MFVFLFKPIDHTLQICYYSKLNFPITHGGQNGGLRAVCLTLYVICLTLYIYCISLLVQTAPVSRQTVGGRPACHRPVASWLLVLAAAQGFQLRRRHAQLWTCGVCQTKQGHVFALQHCGLH